MSEPTRIITMNQMTEIRKVVTDRFEVLAKQLYEVDSRFTFLPRSGYIRFTNIVDGTPVGSCSVISFTGKWAHATTLPMFSLGDGSIITFDERKDSKNLQWFEWVNDDELLVGWKHQLDYYCNGIYSDLMLALKEEAKMMKQVKEENIKKAAKFYELS